MLDTLRKVRQSVVEEQTCVVSRGVTTVSSTTSATNRHNVTYLHISVTPQLLCSGAVLRYQFKPYPKPDRSNRPSAKLVTKMEPRGMKGDPSTPSQEGGKGGSYDFKRQIWQ